MEQKNTNLPDLPMPVGKIFPEVLEDIDLREKQRDALKTQKEAYQTGSDAEIDMANQSVLGLLQQIRDRVQERRSSQ